MGGAESAVRSLVAGLRTAGRDAEIAVLLPPEGDHPFVSTARGEGLEVSEIRHPHRGYLAQVRAVRTLLRDRGVRVLHTHVYHADTIGCLSTMGLGIPWVSTLHGFTDGDLKHRAYTRLDLFLLRRCDAVIGVAENVRRTAVESGLDPRRVHLVPNGYHPTQALDRAAARMELGLDPVRRAVGWIGRLSREKGADLFVEALARAPQDVVGVVVGDGVERSAVEAQARANGLAGDRIRFVGQVDNAARLVLAFDAVVLSSRTEGTPMALLEAMAAGVPVAAFSVGGIPQILGDRSGFLAPSGDPQALAAAISDALVPELAVPRATVAKSIFRERYSIDRCVAGTLAIYDALLETGRPDTGRAGQARG